MKSRISFALSLLLAAAWLFQVAPVFADPDSKEKNPEKRGDLKAESPKEHGGGGDPLRNLSPKEKEKFRVAMRQSWEDPAVLQARNEVNEAAKAYQKALIEAIKRNDPEVMALMGKIKASPDSPIKSLFSGGGPGGRSRPGGSGSGYRGDFEAFLTGETPGFLKNLSEEQRGIYGKAREKALKSPEFLEVVGSLRELRKSDEAMRNKRIELFRRVRQTLHSQMIKADERVKKLLPKEEGFRPKGPPRGPGAGQGKGPEGRKRPETENGKSPEAPGKPE